MTPFEDEITPGIARFVALLQENGFETVDSGDGVSNVECFMSCALETPNVTIKVDRDIGMDVADRLRSFLDMLVMQRDDPEGRRCVCTGECRCGGQLFLPEVRRFGEGEGEAIFLQYDPIAKETHILVFGLDDEGLWGPNPDLAEKRLKYQIRYCNNWLSNPPADMPAEEYERALREEWERTHA